MVYLDEWAFSRTTREEKSMGYCIETDMTVKADQVELAWKTLYDRADGLMKKDNDGEDLSSEEAYLLDFILTGFKEGQVHPIDRLRSAIEKAGFASEFGGAGLRDMSPNTDDCWREHHQEFWKLLAPHMKEGSFVIFQDDEDSTIRRWRFTDRRWHSDECIRMVWDTDPDAAEHLVKRKS
jgi:hypothetical protein